MAYNVEVALVHVRVPYAMLPGHIMSGYAIASKIEVFMASARSEGLKEIIVVC